MGLARIDVSEKDGHLLSLDCDEKLRAAVARQLDEYWARKRREFDLPLDPAGTPFQMDVWRALLEIPFGETRSYKDIAVAVGRPRAVRAVGNAVGKNPIPIIIPCHRVISSDGRIGGFSLGLPLKRLLMKIESIKLKTA
jgi:O-6-methylguanine DNA methyltransferase